jgi:hypothetical protein
MNYKFENIINSIKKILLLVFIYLQHNYQIFIINRYFILINISIYNVKI